MVSFFAIEGIWNSIISEDTPGAILIDDWCSKNTDRSFGNALLDNIPKAFMLWTDDCNLSKNISNYFRCLIYQDTISDNIRLSAESICIEFCPTADTTIVVIIITQ